MSDIAREMLRMFGLGMGLDVRKRPAARQGSRSYASARLGHQSRQSEGAGKAEAASYLWIRTMDSHPVTARIQKK